MADGRVGDDVIARFRENIADELRAQFALRGERLELSDLDDVAEAIVANVDYAFRIERSPWWEGNRR